MNSSHYVPPYQRVVSQSAIRVLLLAQFVTFMPFVAYMPNWFVAVFAVVVFWRWRVLRGQLTKPPFWLIGPAVGLGLLAIFASGFQDYSLDSAVAICLLGYLLKSLEVLRRRDGIFQAYLGFFLTGVYLLYRFDPVGGVLMVLLLFINLLALQAVTSEFHFSWRYAVRVSALMVLAAVPIMILGYLFFPRLPPLWNIPNEQRGAVTGMSDSLNPGSVADLARSTEPAFRVRFEGVIPPRDQWYWRGTTLSDFDGETWTSSYSAKRLFSWPATAQLPQAQGDGYDYNVIMENSGRRWLYFLDWPTQIDAERSQVLPDGRAASKLPVSSLFRYQASSSTQVQWSAQADILARNLELPTTGNRALRQWAQDLRATVRSDRDFIAALSQTIRAENFFYTLRPPLYTGSDGLENFWLGERRGFCEHYASATAFMLRSVGIPARLVGGYLGGTYVESGNYVQVRQMEAHAWVEAWIDGTWLRFDPTAAVAPNRIEMNLDDLLVQSQPSDLPMLTRIGRIGLINQMTMLWDSLNYQWQVTVLNYQNDSALNWFSNSFGSVSPLKLVIFVLSIMAAVAFLVALSLGMIRWPRRQPQPYRALSQLERWYGERASGETVSQYLMRIAQAHPEQVLLGQVSAMIETMLYNPEQSIGAKALQNEVAKLKPKHRQNAANGGESAKL